MLNVICVKIGSKFGSSYVNRLHDMCKHNISQPFQFFCYTDDTTDVHSDVKIIPYIDNNLFPIVYNKLFLFSKHVTDWFENDDTTCFFDLDVVIKTNIDRLFDKPTPNLRVISSNWKEFIPTDIGWPLYDHKINSSCMLWKPSAEHRIWDKFSSNPSFFMRKYHRGMDAYLSYEHNIIGGLPEDMFYSFLYGIDLKHKRSYPTHQYELEVIKKTPIALFNGPTTDQDVEDFITSGYTLSFDRRNLQQRFRDEDQL